MMSWIHDPGGGVNPPGHPVNGAPPVNPDLSTMTPAAGRGSEDSLPGRLRNFAEILNEEQHHRNILEVKLVRTSTLDEHGAEVKAKILTEVDISEFFFDVLQLKVEDCRGIALRTHRYDTKEIKLKKDIDPTPYLIDTPRLFKGHEITVRKQMNNLTRVTFKNIPFNIPDEEIIHLCQVYGEPMNNKVFYEKPSRATRGVSGSTRYVEMKLSPGKQFENYYWMEGPLSGDSGCRITVLHNGQVQQCSHCLRRADICPGGGNGKACDSMKTARGKIADYMRYLRESHRYISLKMEFMEMQFPALGRNLRKDNGFGHMVEVEDHGAPQDHPLEANGLEKDAELENLKKQQVSDMNVLQQQLVMSEAKLKVERNNARTALLKLDHVEKVASQRLVESMPGANFDEDSNHLAMLLATVLEKDDFEYDAETDKVEPKSASDFLKRIEENCSGVPDNAVKLGIIRNKVLEKMKRTLRRERRLSATGSSSSISSSRTRPRSENEELETETAAKIIKVSSLKPPSQSQQSRLPAPKL